MITLLSPSKSVAPTSAPITPTQPHFSAKVDALAAHMATLSPEAIASSMHISEKLAHLNYERYQSWSSTDTTPAGWLFSGDTYNGLGAHSLSADDALFAQDNVAILSGLYGLLAPADAIKPYRLEMGTKMALPDGAANLYQYWGGDIAQYIESLGHTEVVLCASTEYTKAVEPHFSPSTRVVRPRFMQMQNGTLREKGLFAKYARGRMARWIIDTRSTNLADITAYNIDGAAFSPEHSTDDTYVFILPPNFSLAGRFKK